MALTSRDTNNIIPLVVGGEYKLTPGEVSGDWVVITKLTSKYVYAEGIENNHADLKVPKWKFDDLVKQYKINGILYDREDYPYDIMTQDGKYVLDL